MSETEIIPPVAAVTIDPAAPIDDKVATLADAHAANAAAISSLESAHLSLLDRFENLASVVEGMVSKGAAFAETGVLGAPAAEAGGIVQELVNFLHHIFPGHNVPGTVTVPDPSLPVPPAKP